VADIAASNWDEVDANNSSAAPDGAPEGMAPGGLNDVLRAHQGAVKRWYGQSIPKATDGTGTSSAYTLTYSVAPTSLADGMVFLVKFDKANTLVSSVTTLNINNLGAKPIYKWQGGAWVSVAANDLLPNQIERVTYDQASGTFRLLDWVGTAAQYSVGNQANNVVQLDGNGKLPAVDGSQLTNTGFRTGDWKFTHNTTAESGWIMWVDGTIGDASSNATVLKDPSAQALFNLYWANNNLQLYNSSGAPVSRGADAAADWAAHCNIQLPPGPGRTPIIAGSGSGLTPRSLAKSGGAESATVNVSGTVSGRTDNGDGSEVGAGGSGNAAPPSHSHGVNIGFSASGTAAIMPPWTASNAEIKL
jgi:hypothetical protein